MSPNDCGTDEAVRFVEFPFVPLLDEVAHILMNELSHCDRILSIVFPMSKGSKEE